MKKFFKSKNYIYICLLLNIISINTNAKEINVPFENAYSLYLDGDYVNSIEILKNILNDSIYSFNEDYSKERVYNFIGVNNILMGNYSSALRNFNKSLEISKINSNRNMLPVTYINIANLYSHKGEYKIAIDYYNKAISSLSINSKKYNILEYYIINNLGVLFYYESKYIISVKYYKKAVEIGEKHGLDGYEEIYNNVALGYQELGKTDSAEIFFKKSINKFRKGTTLSKLILSRFYLNYGNFLIETGSFSKGLTYYNYSYYIYKNKVGENHPAISELFSYYGEYYLKTKQYKNAIQYFQKSLVAKIPGFNDTSIYINPPKEIIIEDIQLLDIFKNKAIALSLLANEDNNLNLLKLALETYELSIKVIDNLRAGYLSEKSRLDLNRRERETLSAIVNICYNLYEKTGEFEYKNLAFIFSEKSKYSVLKQNINENLAFKIAGVPDSIIQEELSLREKTGAYRKQLLDISMQEKPDSNLEQKINNRLFEVLRQREILINTIEKQYPRYFNLKYNTREVSISDVQNKIKRKDALIEYFFADSLLYTIVITKKRSELYRQIADSIFMYQAQQFYSALYGRYECDNKLYRKSAYFLYTKLIKNLYPLVKEKNLIIIPDERLTYFSFDAMTTEPYTDDVAVDYTWYPYLLYNHAISYALSATLLVQNEKTRRKWRNSFIGFAPNAFKDTDSLKTLDDTENDIINLSKMTHGIAVTGKNATKKYFMQHAPGNDIIQINTHGSVRIYEPMQSKIFFNYIDSINDGYLYLYEIYNINLDTRLMVLPSCYSAFGGFNKGEGMESIAQGLQRTGSCPSMLVSLWVTNNDLSIKLLKYFYKYLIQGKRKDIALQKAKIHFIHDKNIPNVYAEPNLWANHLIIGSNDALYIHYLVKIATIIIPTLLLLIFIIFIRNKRKNSI